jgi:hypothetical protein
MEKIFIPNVARRFSLFCGMASIVLLSDGFAQTEKQAVEKPEEKGIGIKNLEKPFTALSFEKVRVMAVTPDIAPEKPVAKPAPGATGAQVQNQTGARPASADLSGSNFSFGMYLAPPSSSFGTLVRSMQEQVESRSETRNAEARQSEVDKVLGFANISPVHFGPVNFKLSLGTGSVREDALDDYNDRLLEKPHFGKLDEPAP